ncbi:hypothetical protein IAR55_005243 [Kwoniella newhampshirensis]|uniref:F-box domain-containing protein n=1 Tax=Kwoniella newhampshirensis TaxID=1651941 RepID=A0AAW0YVX0_9TREE
MPPRRRRAPNFRTCASETLPPVADEGPSKELEVQTSREAPFVFPTLPTEILGHILSYLPSSTSRPALIACCQVSRTFYALAAPLLWYHLRLTPWKTGSGGEDAKPQVHNDLDERKEKLGGIHNRQRGNKRLREMVRVLTVDHHDEDWCRPDLKTGFDLPNLHTVQIRPSAHVHRHAEDPMSVFDCRLLAVLSPKRLVIHGARTNDPGFTPDSEDGFHSMTKPYLFLAVEELILLCNTPLVDYRDCNWSPWLPDMPQLKRVIWIFTQTGGQRPNSESWLWDRHVPHACSLVGIMASLPHVEVSVVNTGGITHSKYNFLTELEILFVVEKSYKALAESEFRKRGWDENKIDERWSLVKFVSRQEFLDKEDWMDILDTKEAELWGKAGGCLVGADVQV